jgi:hypothetical protein
MRRSLWAAVAIVTATGSIAAPLDWSVSNLGPLAGARTYYHAANGDKDGSIVAARLAGATAGVADTRALNYPPTFTRYADASYFNDVAALTASLYEEAVLSAPASSPALLSNATVVLGSVHRLVLTAGEAMHAKVFPAQVLAFADTWDSACSAAQDGNTVVMVGCDFGADFLWLWIKPATAEGVPPAHVDALRGAEQAVLMRATDSDDFVAAYPCGGSSASLESSGVLLAIHSSLAGCAAAPSEYPRVSALYAQAKPSFAPLPANMTGDSLRDWEWGLPDVTIAAYTALWSVTLGKDPSLLQVLQGDVVSGYLAAPQLWAAYLAANGIAQPRGITVADYWVAQPAVDRLDGTLPFPAYAFYKAEWHPVFSAANATLAQAVEAAGGDAYATGLHTRVYVNGVGSSTDLQGAQLLLAGFSDMNASAWLSYGLDCPPAVCTAADGKTAVDCPHVHAAKVLANTTAGEAGAGLLPPQAWVPLTQAQVAGAVTAAGWGPASP